MRQEAPNTLEKQINPDDVVHAWVPHRQGESFGAEPSVIWHGGP